MIELLIEQMISEGKITREYLDEQIAENSIKPPISNDVDLLKYRQGSTEETVMLLLDLAVMGNSLKGGE